MKNDGNTHFQFSVLGFPVLRLRATPALGFVDGDSSLKVNQSQRVCSVRDYWRPGYRFSAWLTLSLVAGGDV